VSTVALEPRLWRPAPAAEILLPSLPRAARRALEILLMAGSKSDYLENKFKNLGLGAVAFTAPSPVYFGLWTSALTDASVGNTAGETTYGAYARVSVTNNTTNFATVSGNTNKTNSTAITFAAVTSGTATLTYVGVFDGNAGSAADNLLLWADLTVSKSVATGDTPQFAIGDFSWSED
jgi:hypothetical protein